MKVLLLGVTGNVGSHALPALIKHGHTVVAYVRSAAKVTPEMRAVLADVVVGPVTDVSALKGAILTHGCDAVFHAAGLPPALGHSKTGEYNTLFAAVVTAIVEARRERGGAAIRAWLMSGFTLMDSAKPPYLIMDYLPLYPEHRKNWVFIQEQDTNDIAWSLFCANVMTPRHSTLQLPSPPEDCSADNLVVSEDTPPGWSPSLKWVPLIGTFLNIIIQGAGYGTSLEDPADFIATDLERGLQSKYVGKRVAVKEKTKSA